MITHIEIIAKITILPHKVFEMTNAPVLKVNEFLTTLCLYKDQGNITGSWREKNYKKESCKINDPFFTKKVEIHNCF